MRAKEPQRKTSNKKFGVMPMLVSYHTGNYMYAYILRITQANSLIWGAANATKFSSAVAKPI